MDGYKWIRPDIDLNKIVDKQNVITIKNSGVLEEDFLRYAKDFNEAANTIMKYLLTDAADRHDIAKLDLWYFSLIYLYRQSIELLIKANIFRFEVNKEKRIELLKTIGHDVKAGYDELLKLSATDISSNDNAQWLSKFLEDISNLDKDSDMFRYPFNNKTKALFDYQAFVYLPAAYYNMNRAFDLLKGFYKTNVFSDEKCKIHELYEPKLIIEGGDYYHQSVVGYKYAEGSYFPYNTSYAECGEFLESKIKETGKTNLFMPMCYLYRNAVELGLKKIIMESSRLDRETALKTIHKKKHKLVGLWNKIKDELKSHAYDPTDPTIDYVEKYICAFHEYDLSSSKFRYPCSNDLEIYYEDETEIDMENLSDCFVELIHFLDGADCMLSYKKECEAEYAQIETEMASYFSELEAEMLSDYNDFHR